MCPPADRDTRDPQALAAARAELTALRRAGRLDEAVVAARSLAASHPDVAVAQMEAAFACDRLGLEAEAVTYYERAHTLGVPAEHAPGFLLGYGSTLRNVGRADDAVALLGAAAAEHPEYAPLRAFLGLALLSAGHPRAAAASLIGVILDVATPGSLHGFDRALAEYASELLDADVGKPR